MERENTTKIKGEILLGIIFALELYALPVQFYLLLKNPEFTFFSAAVRFFSFFTITTNTIVFLCSALLLFGGKSKANVFFRKCTTLTAITVYILIVGIVFNLLLRSTLHLEGHHLIVSEIFHTVVPILFFVFWLFFVSPEKISFKVISYWLIYPIIYIIYTLFHGLATEFYPYPFIDATQLGFQTAIINGFFVLLSFVILSIILISIFRIKTKSLT
ncbi:Pr6Pr family membrane protein [Flavobacterium tyrosinilyticum]|uniref:Pr6Pr family membrane protein n=1 Tax=Flavobacterium tyrosinilyticum TaxID=1658740 RepID=UPI00202ECE21|nr:Pr6Pr family membrane protein [Flavobacterium tyrosinilyticum]MCM0667395.1 Pr6Pr family membrane protein [Flavobacterium tyrosinilyticum]